MAYYKILKEYPHYEIYDNGMIVRRSHRTPKGIYLKRREICQTRQKNGYKVVHLKNKDFNSCHLYVHRLVWEAFYGTIPSGYEIDHISTDRNDCSLQNLRIQTHKDNCHNPISLNSYRQSNSLSRGKYDRDRLQNARTQESYEKAKETYISLFTMYGRCGIMLLMSEAHVGYKRAKRIINEVKTYYGEYNNQQAN